VNRVRKPWLVIELPSVIVLVFWTIALAAVLIAVFSFL